MYSRSIDEEKLEKIRELDLRENELGNWQVLNMNGDGERAPENWNVAVYENKYGDLTLVTNDKRTLDDLLEGKERPSEEGKRIIQVDDSGWGFPLGGVLAGVYDLETDDFWVREITPEFFQDPEFSDKKYLDEYAKQVLDVFKEFEPSREDSLIKICTGYINDGAKGKLRRKGYEMVEVDRIGEPLQSTLEESHRKYIIDNYGEDVYYDPKELGEGEIAQKYREVLEFIEENGLWEEAKTGWKSLNKE